ncbi:nucleotide-binding universal stress UspA family protein [Mycetocola sp. CAN_C7]|uniref:universal stress protein n=1 Tax=Mycetocola sp. CAN_C7 TaxID=2787724 RepID=UPI0018CA2830
MSEETVVGWDGSSPAHRALEWALRRAEARSDSVLIASVVTEQDVTVGRTARETVMEAAEGALEQARRAAQSQHPRLTIGSRLLFGDPVEELRSLSDENTLVVVGTHSSHESDVSTAWSIGARLAATSYGPVALVPDSPASSDAGRSGIVAGVDGSAVSLIAAQYAAAEAVRQGEMLTAVHAWQVPPMWAGSLIDDDTLHALEEVHRGILDTVVGRIQRQFPTLTIAKSLVRQPAMAALNAAAAHSRLLVLGNHGLKVAPRLMLGPVSHSMARRVEVTMVIVRETEHAS